MAPVLNLLRTCGLIVSLILNVHAVQYKLSEPWIVSVKVKEKTCVENNCKYLLNVLGGEFLGHYSWRLTPKESSRGSECVVFNPNYELRELETAQWETKIELVIPDIEGKYYFCVHHASKQYSPFGGKWVHQGSDLFLDPKNDIVFQDVEKEKSKTNQQEAKQAGNLEEPSKNWLDLSHDTDINHLPNVARPTRNERKDIEFFLNGKYVPLNDEESHNNEIKNIKDFSKRKKRETRANQTDELITKYDIVNAKIDLQNSIQTKEIPIENHEDALIKVRKERQAAPGDFTSVKAVESEIRIEGLRVENSAKEQKIIEESIPSVLADTRVTIRLFGEGLTPRTIISFTYDAMPTGQHCKFLVKGEYMAIEDSITPKSALFEITAPPPSTTSKLYICAKNLKPGVTDPFADDDKYVHQGSESYKVLAIHKKLLPLWVSLTLILICLMFSALFSGLNLGLMSLDRTELKIISNTGTDQERKYARAIMPVRDHGNYLLCSILLGNVAVNSTFTILLDEMTSGLYAVIFSTLSIVLLGEITPQAICSRHGLMVGAKSIMITKAVMAVTAPLAYPVSKLLDYFLGEEIGSVYNRERLKELVKVTTDVNDLDKDEVNIISGALELRKKSVADVMTKLEDVFMLPISSVLDFETMSEIVKSGYSRIPVYEGGRGDIVTVLFIKDLAFVDPDDNTPLRTLCQYYQNPCNFVFEDVTLDVMFRQFKEGHKGHMAFVHRINNEGEGDPFYETIGLVTLEDVIEEMIQAEIVDETDVFMDNRTKRRRNKPQHKLQDFAAFAERHENQRIHISPQLTLATFQFLSSSVDAFRPDTVSETVLRRLLKQDVIQYIKLKGKTKKDPTTFVFQQGKPVDYFVLILEGRVEVTVGRENLVFEAGPFTYFGVQALTQNVGVAESPTPSAMGSLQNINMDAMLRHTFVPDYSVRAITELYYLTVKRSLYLAAKRATLMEKGALSKGATNEQFDTEVDKHLWNSCSAIPMSMLSKKLLGKSTSTASSKDDVESASTAYKLSPRLNIIELMQISQQQNYESSTQLEAASNSVKSSPSRLANSWPNTGAVVANSCDVMKRLSSWDVKCWANGQDTSARSQLWPQDISKHNDLDAHHCAECVKNNFWMTESVLNKRAEIEDAKSIDQGYKKKRTTFHTDSSLLTFHQLSPAESRGGSPVEPELERAGSARLEAKIVEMHDQLMNKLTLILDALQRDLLQSVDEDMSISGEHKTPSRQVSPNPLPVSASPHTRSSFASRASPEPRGDYGARADEQEKLLKSP